MMALALMAGSLWAKDDEVIVTRQLTMSQRSSLPEKTKKVYNILGDYPETIVNYVVPRMIRNKKNDGNIVWLTGRRAFFRFLTAGFRRRNFFSETE